MRLVDLEPRFIRYESRIETYTIVDGDQATWRERGSPTKEVTGPKQYIINVDTLTAAQGIMFLCPKCFKQNSGNVGTHWCQVTFADRGATNEQGTHDDNGKPVRWSVSGTGFEDLSTVPSILLIGGCGWHGFITNGVAS